MGVIWIAVSEDISETAPKIVTAVAPSEYESGRYRLNLAD